jgi:3-oxoacyl-[acyl-carrier-protein] synthase II
MSRNVVVTGVGAVTALGVGAQALWDGLCAGRSGLRPIARFDASGFHTSIGGEVPEGFSARDFVPKHYRKATKVMARDIELAVAAAKEAAEDARLVTRGMLAEDATEGTTYPLARMGCHIGAGLIAAESDELAAALSTASTGAGEDARVDLDAWGRTGMDNLTPLWMLKYLPNMLACHVTIIHGCEGPSNTITCTEASGLLCAGESTRVIERDDADLCFTGAAESKLNLMGLLRMQMAGRLASTPPGATDASAYIKPFDPTSAGGFIGEGAGILVLEEQQSAAKRGATPYARVAGVGAGHSPRRPVAGEATIDDGFLAACENALADAGLRGAELDAVVVTGTGVPGLDAGEGLALAHVLGAHAAACPVITLAPSIGNTVAGAGGLLAVVASLMLRHQRLPARLHTGTPAHVHAHAAPSQARSLRHVLAVTGSLGGQNAAVVLSRV